MCRRYGPDYPIPNRYPTKGCVYPQASDWGVTSLETAGAHSARMTMELAFGLLCGAGLIGLALALLYLRGPGAPPPHPAIAALHGGIGAASLAVLLLALDRGQRHRAMGTAGFGRTAAALLALALVLGLSIAVAAWRRRRPAGALVGAHAGLAIAGLVMLWALLALG